MIDINRLFSDINESNFDAFALDIFNYQAKHVKAYQYFLDYMNVVPNSIHAVEEIPFLPIQFFKNYKVSSKDFAETIFTSSGTTGSATSKHYVSSVANYHKQLKASFKQFYGDFEDYIIFPLLPAYAERSGSSLIAMVDYWMKQTGQFSKDYYLYNHEKLANDLTTALKSKKKVILIGVSFALIDFAESYPLDLSSAIIIETGGMKGRKKEITREQLHLFLNERFNTSTIQSEYGMTELLSQAYAKQKGIFVTPNWMKVLIRDASDPLSYVETNKSGGINVIDLANIDSCSFIATDDLGRLHTNNRFEVLGRFDTSDVRGCNLLTVND